MPKGKTRRSAHGDIEEEMGLEPDTGGNPAARMRPALLLRAEPYAGHHRHDRGRGFLLSGVLGIVFYVRFRSMMSVSGWSLAYAILDVLIGLMFVLHPLVGGAAISWLVALCFLVFGLFEIFAAMKSKKHRLLRMGDRPVLGHRQHRVRHHAVRLADLVLSARSRVRAVARRRDDRRRA